MSLNALRFLVIAIGFASHAFAEEQRYDVEIRVGRDVSARGELTRFQDAKGERFTVTLDSGTYPIDVDAKFFRTLDEVISEVGGERRAAVAHVPGGYKNAGIKGLVLRLDSKSPTPFSIARTGGGKMIVREVLARASYAHRDPGRSDVNFLESEIPVASLKKQFDPKFATLAVPFGDSLVPVIDLTPKIAPLPRSRLVVAIDDIEMAAYGTRGIRTYRVPAASYVYFDPSALPVRDKTEITPFSERTASARPYQVGTLWAPQQMNGDFHALVGFLEVLAAAPIAEDFDLAVKKLKTAKSVDEYLDILYRQLGEKELDSLRMPETISRLIEKTSDHLFSGKGPTLEQLKRLLSPPRGEIDPQTRLALKKQFFNRPGAIRTATDYVALADAGTHLLNDQFVNSTMPSVIDRFRLTKLDFADLMKLISKANGVERESLETLVEAAREKIDSKVQYKQLAYELLPRLRNDADFADWFLEGSFDKFLTLDPTLGEISRFIDPNKIDDPVFLAEGEPRALARKMSLTAAKKTFDYLSLAEHLVQNAKDSGKDHQRFAVGEAFVATFEHFFSLAPNPVEVNWLGDLMRDSGVPSEVRETFWVRAIHSLRKPSDYWNLNLPGRLSRSSRLANAMKSFRVEHPDTFTTTFAKCRLALRGMLLK